jgi:molecular chaperone HtpG
MKELSMSTQPQAETLDFGADVKQLLKLVAHSLYSHSEIFLRELISNASDALDKLRYQALSNSALFENDPDGKIHVEVNKTLRTITVRDNGIGMTRQEVIDNLGTIARSGTQAFSQMLKEQQSGKEKTPSASAQLIGQFGVGFYSAFIVSDKVIVRTRKAGMKANEGVEWVSDGQGAYTVKNIEKSDRGTEVILHLRKNENEFLDDMRLRSIIHKYSDHILWPVMMKKIEVDQKDKDKDKKKKVEKVLEEVVNQAKALWTLPKNKIKPEEYNELYKHISHDFDDPLAWTHNRVEGKLEYTSLLYIPKRAPFDLWNREQKHGLKLYVKRVFIMDNAEQLLPLYLRFVKGIVDSNDLPLNISRELLQSNQTVEKIKSGCQKRIFNLLEQLVKNEPEKYQTFWNEFGEVLKEGVIEDFANKDRIAKLTRFASTHTDSDAQTVSFDDYIKRMKDEQDKIYYVIADNFNAAKNSPLLEVFKQKGIEVLLLFNRVDEWYVQHLSEYEGKKLQSIAKGAVDLGQLEDKVEKEEVKKQEKTFESLVKQLKEILKDRAKDVRLTNRLTSSPVCVVFDEHDMSGHMQRLMQAAGQAMPQSKPILELNPKHRLVARLNSEADEAKVKTWANVLLDQALLAEGEKLSNPAEFVKQLNDLLTDNI